MTQAHERIMQFPNDYPEERIITWRDDETGEFVGMCKYIRADLVPQWQPIETAPRDADILVIQTQNNIIRVARGINEHGYWRTGIAPMDYIAGVTHWMPLPSPPA